MKDHIKELVESILDRGHLMSLATLDESGLWVSDVIFVHDNNLNLYWLSRIDTRHSQAILKEPRVAATITISNRSKEPNEGLQISGIAEKVEGDILLMATAHRLKRSKPVPQHEGEILDVGESWYCLKPLKIELIYEPEFGYSKQQLR